MAIYLCVASEPVIWIGPFDKNIPYSVQSIRVRAHLVQKSFGFENKTNNACVVESDKETWRPEAVMMRMVLSTIVEMVGRRQSCIQWIRTHDNGYRNYMKKILVNQFLSPFSSLIRVVFRPSLFPMSQKTLISVTSKHAHVRVTAMTFLLVAMYTLISYKYLQRSKSQSNTTFCLYHLFYSW